MRFHTGPEHPNVFLVIIIIVVVPLLPLPVVEPGGGLGAESSVLSAAGVDDREDVRAGHQAIGFSRLLVFVQAGRK